MPIAVIHTLGCRVNHADTSLLISRLKGAGFEVQESPESAGAADLVVVNSCAVTAEAVAKTRQLVRKLRRTQPRARIVVLGCAAAVDAEALAACGADIVRGNPFKPNAPDFSAPTDFSPVFRENALSDFSFRTRAFIKIQEGCNNFCSYCIVPYVRGRERSRSFAEILDDCRAALDRGAPEIVLTGVNITSYNDGGVRLADLLDRLAGLPGDFRLRIGSAEPSPEQLALVEVIAAHPGKICRFLHLSLQHGCDRILQLMRRHYRAAEFRDFVLAARERIPDLHLGTDVIVGFPGETEADFAASLEFIRQLDFANIHRFIYSPRAGTAAAEFPDRVSGVVARRRSAELGAVAAASAAAFRRSQLGKVGQVIFEQEKSGRLWGWSDNYLQVAVPAGSAETGRIVAVKFSAENLPERQ